MGFYIPERKAMYLSPARLEALHRRKGLNDETGENCVICRLARGNVTWAEFACWLRVRGFRVEKVRPNQSTMAAPGLPYTRFGWLKSYGEFDRLFDLLEEQHP